MGKINTKNILPGCIFTVLLFLMWLFVVDVPGLQFIFKHIDEVLVLGCIAYLVLHIHYLFRKKWKLLYPWLGFMAIGTVSSILFRYQAAIPAATDAIVVVSKFMVGYLTAYVYASLHPGRLTQRLIGAARIITVFLFVLAVHDLVMSPFFPKGEFRYFTQSIHLMFPHQTYLAAAMVTLLVLLGYTDSFHKNIPYMLMATFVGMLTLRGKAIAFFAVYWVLYICILIFKNRNYTGLLIGGGIGCIIIGFQRITLNFLDKTRFMPRQIMLKDSIPLALENFPFGTGFGSFGSSIAAQHYSPLYEKLGYTEYTGMGTVESTFLTDSFWPEIIAQFGLIGTALFVDVVIILLAYCFRTLKKNRIAGFSMLMIMVNMLINSLAESSFFNPASFLLFILFGLFEAEVSNCPSSPNRIESEK